LCISTTAAQTPTSSITPGGVYSSTAGLIIDATTGAINSSASAPGDYTVNYDIAPSAGCGAFNAKFDVVITPASAIKIEEGCDLSFYKLKAIPVLTSFDPLTTTYSWTGTGSLPFEVSTTEPSAIILKSPGTYTVTITTADGCKSTESITVTDIGCTIQKGISPGVVDGKNDSFDLTGFNVEKIEIFNRYGTEVFSYGAYTDQWHGQASGGEDLPDGTYFYVINRKGGITTTGWIYINRQY
jgi:gliding motility-associated-like protein